MWRPGPDPPPVSLLPSRRITPAASRLPDSRGPASGPAWPNPDPCIGTSRSAAGGVPVSMSAARRDRVSDSLFRVGPVEQARFRLSVYGSLVSPNAPNPDHLVTQAATALAWSVQARIKGTAKRGCRGSAATGLQPPRADFWGGLVACLP
jgi:hypothetical protein